jgi:pimeloyl-ACP methyl ester carboxylesterase
MKAERCLCRKAEVHVSMKPHLISFFPPPSPPPPKALVSPPVITNATSAPSPPRAITSSPSIIWGKARAGLTRTQNKKTTWWSEQIVSFIKNVIGRPVYISGNSLGGFLATTVAAQHPEWVKGVILLNSTPFWSFAPNRKKLQKWVKEVCIIVGREGGKEGGRGREGGEKWDFWA